MNKAWNSTLRASKKPLRAKKPWEPKGGMNRPQKPTTSKKKPMASRGMKGRPVTAEQKRFHDQMASLGCIASLKDGFFDPMVSIHHINGRTDDDAHWLVLPLSAGNHQDGTGAPGRIAVHPYKGQFEARYGKQMDLLRECIQMLLARGVDVPEAAIEAAGMKKENPAAAATALGAIQRYTEVY